nr:uncharacterized protein LOC106692481 [Halyomorpha halys]
MLKVFFGGCLCSILVLFVPIIKNEDIYDENYDHETEYDNSTEEYDTQGRNEQLISELRPVYPVNHYFGSGPQNNLQELLNYERPYKRPGLKKRRILKKKGYKFIVPLLLSVLTKIANFLPVAKLTLLVLFTLVLFSKKALLVSIGSLILVIYDNFYNKRHKGTNTVKDRASTVPTVDQGSLVETDLEEGWWGRDETRPQRFDYPQDIKKNNGRKWWAPQINLRRKLQDLKPLNDDSKVIEDELVLNKFIYS